MNPIIYAIILSLTPISELRGGIPVAVAAGYGILFSFVICVVANLLAIPITFFFLDYLHKFFMRIDFYKNSFNKFLEKARTKIEKSVGEKGQFVALMVFVGVPLPATGAYTGTLLAWFFNMDRKKAYAAIGLGVLLAGLIVSLVIFFGLKTLSFLVKNGFV